MIVNHIGGFASIDEYVSYRLAKYEKEEKNFESLFHYMFDEQDNIMAESSDGYRIRTVTYGAFKDKILSITPTVAKALCSAPKGSMVGLYMGNCMEWIELFWAILLCGCNPLLMNTLLSDDVLEEIIKTYNVSAVISDGKRFSCPTFMKEDMVIESTDPLPRRGFGDQVIFMSSGTASSVKLCAYTGENFYYQICDSVNIVKTCPSIKKHYEGELKQLVLLPFYHVFGFIAVYIWFGFFSRTFVFPKDLNPVTIQNTVKKHKVTHIFAVPMVWEAVYKAAMNKIRSRGARTEKKFRTMSGIINRMGDFGDVLAKHFMREVREGLFGDSICCMITGGSHIDPAVLSFFNGIGYHLVNGYGMTEIGITSVEKAQKKSICNTGSIGAPFGYTEYRVGDGGELEVKGRTRAACIMQDGVATPTDYDSWFATKDIVEKRGDRYYMHGRMDDLIICENGENLNPVLAEKALKTEGIDRLCIFAGAHNVPVLIASVPGCFSGDKLSAIYDALCENLRGAKLEATVQKILFTHESLLSGNDFKISRRKIAQRYKSGELRAFDPRNLEEHLNEILSELETQVRDCFTAVLDRDAETIGVQDNFFTDLGGTSLDYFALLGDLKNRFGVELLYNESERLTTIKDICTHIRNN